MKTVSGKAVSSEPISLSRAAKTLSKFSSSDNGASPAYAAYLRRTTASFEELVQVHKLFKVPGTARKGKTKKNKHRPESSVSEVVNYKNINDVGEDGDEGLVRKGSEEGGLVEERVGRSEIRSKRRNDGSGKGDGGEESVGTRLVVEGKGEDVVGGDENDGGKSVEKGTTEGEKMVVDSVVDGDGNGGGDKNEVEKEEDGSKDVKGVMKLEVRSKRRNDRSATQAVSEQKGEEVDAPDVGGETISSKKKKRERAETTSSVEKDRMLGDLGVVNVTGADNGLRDQGESEETQKKIKKMGEDKMETSDGAAKIEKEELGSFDQDAVGNGVGTPAKSRETKKKNKKRDADEGTVDTLTANKKEENSSLNQDAANEKMAEIVVNDSSQGKKSKKKRGKEKQSNGNEDSVRMDENSNVDGTVNVIQTSDFGPGAEKRHKKKRSHDTEQRGNAGKVEMQEIIKSESRKRKHSEEGLDDAEQQHKSKKKKRKSEGV